jgi:hypothetical protein
MKNFERSFVARVSFETLPASSLCSTESKLPVEPMVASSPSIWHGMDVSRGAGRTKESEELGILSSMLPQHCNAAEWTLIAIKCRIKALCLNS